MMMENEIPQDSFWWIMPVLDGPPLRTESEGFELFWRQREGSRTK
jgi:hypothetical protein